MGVKYARGCEMDRARGLVANCPGGREYPAEAQHSAMTGGLAVSLALGWRREWDTD